MWIDVDTIIKTAALVTALGVLGGVAVSLYRASERDRKQSEIIKEMMAEQSLICYGLAPFLQLLFAVVDYDAIIHKTKILVCP